MGLRSKKRKARAGEQWSVGSVDLCNGCHLHEAQGPEKGEKPNVPDTTGSFGHRFLTGHMDSISSFLLDHLSGAR